MLAAALLGPGDLPAGFTVTTPPSGLGDSSLSGCPPLSTDPPGASATASVALLGSAAAITETLVQLPSAAATTAMADFTALPTTCGTFSGVVQGAPVAFTTAPLPLGSFGDATASARITATLAAGVTIDEDVVVVRHGNTIIFVVNAGLSADSGLTSTAARAAVARVTARW